MLVSQPKGDAQSEGVLAPLMPKVKFAKVLMPDI